MEFFYSSLGGAIDALAMAVICLAVLVFGTARGRIAAASVLAVYLADRFIMWNAAVAMWPVYGAVVEFVALLAILNVVPGLLGRAMAALFTIKIAIYAMLLAGFVNLAFMENMVTVAVYLQLIVVLTGVSGGGYFKRLWPDRRSGPSHRIGLASVAQRLDAE